MRQAVKLINPVQAHAVLTGTVWPAVKTLLIGGDSLHLEVRTETRSTAQNRMLWARLGDIARQVEWHGQYLRPDDWKAMATAALKRQRVVPGIDGGFVVLGQSTSRMTVAEMTELLEFLAAFGDERGVQWSRTSLGRDWPDMEIER